MLDVKTLTAELTIGKPHPLRCDVSETQKTELMDGNLNETIYGSSPSSSPSSTLTK